MSKKAPLKAAPTGDTLTAEEQKFFDTGGEEGGTTATAPVEKIEPVVEPETPEPEQEEGTSPETAAPEVGQQPTQKQPQKMVPHQALHEAREQAKEYKEQLKTFQQNYKTLEERTNLLLQNLTQQPAKTDGAQPQQAFPDPENDPLGYILASVKTLDERTKQFEAAQKQQTEQGQQYTALSQLQNEALAREQEFRTETPDYDAASQHLQKTRSAELAALGYNPSEVRDMLRNEAIGIAQRMIQQGKTRLRRSTRWPSFEAISLRPIRMPFRTRRPNRPQLNRQPGNSIRSRRGSARRQRFPALVAPLLRP